MNAFDSTKISYWFTSAALLAFSAILFFSTPGAQQIGFLKHEYFYIQLAALAGLITLLILPRFSGTVPARTRNFIFPGLIIIAVYALTAFKEPFEFKVLQDEAALSASAMNIHYNRINEVPYNAHQLSDAFELGRGYTDKRSSLYPALVALAHDLGGYRVENAFYINSVIYLLTLFAIYAVVKKFARDSNRLSQSAIVAVLVFAMSPLVTQNATGGGFELLNVLFIVLLLQTALVYGDSPTRTNLAIFLLTLFLLANLRYESIIFIPFAIVVILFSSKRIKLAQSFWLFSGFALLLVPTMFQLNISFNRPNQFEVSSAQQAAFSINYFAHNFSRLIDYLFNTAGDRATNPVISMIGLLSLAGTLVHIVKHRKEKKSMVVLAWLALILIQLVTVLSFHNGDVNSHATNRYILPLIALFSISTGIATVPLMANRFGRIAVYATMLFSAYFYYLPTVSNHTYSLKNFFNYRDDWVMNEIDSMGYDNPLIISGEPLVFMLNKYSSTHLKLVNREPDKLAFHLSDSTFDAAFIVQNVIRNPLTGEEKYPLGHMVNPAFQTSPAATLNIAPYSNVRLLKISSIDLARSKSIQEIDYKKSFGFPGLSSTQRRALRDFWYENLP